MAAVEKRPPPSPYAVEALLFNLGQYYLIQEIGMGEIFMSENQLKCIDCGVNESAMWMRCFNCFGTLCLNCGIRGRCPICGGNNIQYV